MVKLILKPNVGVDKVNLGMTREEVHKEIADKRVKLPKNATYNNSRTVEDYYSGIFRVNYDSNDIVNFIEIANPYSTEYQVLLDEVSIFETKAEELVSFIQKFASYDKDNSESKMGYSYIFKDIGLSLWRPNVFKEEYMKESWFQELNQDNREDEMKYLYFQSVGIAVNDYWKQK